MIATKQKKPAKAASKRTKANGSTEPPTTPKQLEANGGSSQTPSAPPHTGPGRPTSYTKEMGTEICELVAMRVPLIRICEMSGMPSERTVYSWKRLHPEFLQEYARAREHRADARADRIDEICEDLRAGKIDPNTARVLADCEKWQAGREKPAVYGDRVETRLADANGEPLQIQATIAVRALLEALPDLGVLPLNRNWRERRLPSMASLASRRPVRGGGRCCSPMPAD